MKSECHGIEVKVSPGKGRGVFATKNFQTGDIIEVCPTLRLTPKERKQAARTVLDYYMYPWRSTRSASIALGFGSLYNHSYSPNADWKQNFTSRTMVYRAVRPIKKGEEITVNYNGEPDDMTPVDWMEDQPPMQS